MPSMEMDDEDKFDLVQSHSFEADYPPGLRFRINGCCFDALGLALDDVDQGQPMHFAAMTTVQSINITEAKCRVELEVAMLSLNGGPWAELQMKPFICFGQRELDLLDLDSDCDRDDLLHLTGIARVVEIDKPREDMGGQDSIVLQIEELDVDNESDEEEGDEE